MHFDKKTTQEYVDRFSEEIRRNTGLPLEDITVEEINHKSLLTPIMWTDKGKIYIYPDKHVNYRRFPFEYVVLHELGHRVANLSNPVLNEILDTWYWDPFTSSISLREDLEVVVKKIRTGNIFIDYSIKEGLAEFFAL
ncbi:MAG: hypothetical protein V1743_00970, partial [Nanoarchaeota archaeon]